MNITVLNITPNSLKALELKGTALKRQEAPLPPGILKNGLILQPETMGREIKALFRNGKLNTGRVICAINGLPFTYRILTIPGMEKDAFNEAVLRMAKNEMSISPDEMYLSWQAYPVPNGEYQALVMGITRRPVDNLIKSLNIAGISPYLIDLPHLALARLSPYPDAVIVDFEKDCSNIVLLADGVPRGMQMVPDITPAASLHDRIAQVMDKLARMIEFYNSSRHLEPLKETAKILVTGELLEEDNALEYVRPQGGFTIETLASKRHSLSGKSIRGMAVNAGMLDILQTHGKGAALSQYLDMGPIVKESRPKTNIAGILKKMAVPAMLVAGLALLALSFMSLKNYQADYGRLEAELSQANTQLEQKQSVSDDSQQAEAQISELSARAHEISSGKQAIFAPREYVAEAASVIACLPPNVTVNTLEIDAVEIALSGTAAEPEPVILFADNLETAGGFSQAIITWIDRPHDMGETQQLFFRISVTRG